MTTIESLVPIMFETAIKMGEEALANCTAVSCGIDFWTSLAKRKYLAISYHGMSANWKLCHYVLDLVHFPGAKFAELTGAVVKNRVDMHVGNQMLLSTVTSDRGSDVKAARNNVLEADGEDCFNHLEQSALTDVFKKKDLQLNKDVEAISHVISLVESDYNLKLFFAKLQEVEGFEKVLVFVTKNDTRWEGFSNMLERFLRFKDVFLSKKDELQEFKDHIETEWPDELPEVFKKAFFKRIKGYLETLKPFSIASKSVQSLQYPTASRIPGLIHSIQQVLRKTHEIEAVNELRKELDESVMNRCGHYLSTVNNALKAALVDPSQSRFVSTFGVPEDIIEKCWEHIALEGQNFCSVGQKDSESDSKNEDPFMVDAESTVTLCQTATSVLRKGLQHCKVKQHETDPLAFYRDNDASLNRSCGAILPVVRMLLAIPGGESHCERAFSWVGDFVTKKRSRLGNSMVEMLMVLYDTFKKPDFDMNEFKAIFAIVYQEYDHN